MSLKNDQKLRFLEIEVGLVQSRFDKMDQQFQWNRKITVTIIFASAAASTALSIDAKAFLIASAIVPYAFLIIELFHRMTLFRKLVQRHIILRAALNDTSIIDKITIYDPFNDMDFKVKKRWGNEISIVYHIEMFLFYILLSLIPLAVLFFI